jgi:hypothetical protein
MNRGERRDIIVEKSKLSSFDIALVSPPAGLSWFAWAPAGVPNASSYHLPGGVWALVDMGKGGERREGKRGRG